MKKIYSLYFVLILALSLTSTVLAAEKSVAKASDDKKSSSTPKVAADRLSVNPMVDARSNFSMLVGTVSKVDTTDPANVKLEVKDDRDSKVHIIEVTPATNVTKVTEISEIKIGDTVRVMARKVDNKEVAMGIMFGIFKKIPLLKPSPIVGKPKAQIPAPAVKEVAKK